MKITILGCGGSAGVPIIGCDCEVCRSDNPKNKRTRVSVLVETGGKHLLIDTSPDLRQQALRSNITEIDAVLFTHDHADHVNGLDDIRPFNTRKNAALPAYSDKNCLETIKTRYPYIFKPHTETHWSRPCVQAVEIGGEKGNRFTAAEIDVQAIEQGHGKVKTLGFRIGKFAYSTDVNHFSDEAFEKLANLELWIVDCLGYSTSYTHAHLEMTLSWISRAQPKTAILTHMGHELDYEKLSTELPTGVFAAFDGMVLEINDNAP